MFIFMLACVRRGICSFLWRICLRSLHLTLSMSPSLSPSLQSLLPHRSNPEHLLATKEKPDLPFSLFPDPELNRQSLVYRIKDDIIYSLIIEEYDGEKGGWGPYHADDVQLEFVMLDPHVRTFLECEKETGRFWKLFKVPDTYGVFKFRILYRRPGVSVLAVNTQVSVRPFNHDEYERFIFSAFPYYASAFSMMAGFLVFGVAFLYSKPKAGGGGKSTKRE